MQNNTARKLAQIPLGYLIVGIDPHKKKHAVVVMTPNSQVTTSFKIDACREGFERLMERVRGEVARTGGSGAIFSIEAGGHYWRTLAYYLDEAGWSFRLISPFTLKRQREGEDLNRHKNDYRDARMAAELLRTGKFTETSLPKGNYAELRALHQCYVRLRRERAGDVNLLRALLDGVWPEFCGVFKDPAGQTATAVIVACVEPSVVAGLGEEEFISLVRANHRGKRVAVKKLRLLYRMAGESVGVKPGARGVGLELKLLAERLRALDDQLEVVQLGLRELVHSFEESEYLLSVPGLGEISIAGLIAEIGPIDSYGNAKDLVKLAGTNPILSESAEKAGRYTPMSKKGRAQLRGCLWQAAVRLLATNEEYRDWASEKANRPGKQLHRRQIVGAVMNKVLKMYYALVSNKEMYQPARVREARAA